MQVTEKMPTTTQAKGKRPDMKAEGMLHLNNTCTT